MKIMILLYHRGSLLQNGTQTEHRTVPVCVPVPVPDQPRGTKHSVAGADHAIVLGIWPLAIGC